MMVENVLRILRAHAPDRDWTRELGLLGHLRRKARRNMGHRKQGRIVSSRLLFETGLEHALSANSSASTPLAQATRYRDGVMIAFLAAVPLRVRSVVELELGTSALVKGDHIVIAVSEDMSKNATFWEAPVPKALEPRLRHYIDEVRPFLLARWGEHHAHLWVKDRGRPFKPQDFGARVRDVTKKLLGISVTPHFFRDAAATTLARESPTDAKLIRSVLGHLSFDVAEQHYIQAQRIEAGRDYAAVLETITKGTG
jgi:site-specific recombinase XerD